MEKPHPDQGYDRQKIDDRGRVNRIELRAFEPVNDRSPETVLGDPAVGKPGVDRGEDSKDGV